jgi:hypothetical protein
MPEESKSILPLPHLPALREFQSPNVVRVLDRIRFALDGAEDSEFAWFAREYPRCYRHHLDGADFRLRTIHGLITEIWTHFSNTLNYTELESAVSDMRVRRIYWDFEAYLSNVSVALDLLARILTPGYSEHKPLSFSKLIRSLTPGEPFQTVLARAQSKWVMRLKDYRDCFTHYTPIDTFLTVSAWRTRAGYQVRAKLPTNPNVREIVGFRYSMRVDLLRYAIAIHRHMAALDRGIAKEISARYEDGTFPRRKEHLFFVGRRERPHEKRDKRRSTGN